VPTYQNVSPIVRELGYDQFIVKSANIPECKSYS